MSAQWGILAVRSVKPISISAGTKSKTRWAKTVPSSVAVAPSWPGMRRVSTATRANSPSRPGRTAFASSPIAKPENVRWNGGWLPGRASSMTTCHARARVTTDARLSRIASDDPAPLDDTEDVGDEVPLGPAPPEHRRDAGECDDDQ